mgnify:CR=1 FL=1
MKSNLNPDKLSMFIKTENQTLYDILLDENVVGEENLESDFGISVGDKGEQQLKSKLLDESSNIISKLLSYSYEIRENSIPLYSGNSSFMSHSDEFELHLFQIDNYYISLTSGEWSGVEMELFKDFDSCLKSCSTVLSDHLSSIEVELSNYEENKKYYDDSESDGYGMSLEMEWNFPLPYYLYEKGIISKGRLNEIETTLEKVDSF